MTRSNEQPRCTPITVQQLSHHVLKFHVWAIQEMSNQNLTAGLGVSLDAITNLSNSGADRKKRGAINELYR